jgi:RNA polymerase-binding protein DksA
MKRPRRKRDVTELGSVQRKAACSTREVLATAWIGPVAAKRIDQKWSWHYRFLLKLRDQLVKERREHLGRVKEPLERHSLNMADSASDEFDHNLALSEVSAEQSALYEVDEAIRRIMDGTYGTCQETGKPIAVARLRAVPWTRFSKEVELRLERTGAVIPSHLGALSSVRGETQRNLEDSESEDEKQPPAPDDESLRQVSLPPELPRRAREAAPRKSKFSREEKTYEKNLLRRSDDVWRRGVAKGL